MSTANRSSSSSVPSSSSSSSSCVSCSAATVRTALQVAPCGHCYCRACLKRLARLALMDRTLVPLRCCRKELATETVAFAFSLASSAERATRELTQYETLLAAQSRHGTRSALASDAEYAATVGRIGGKQCPGCGVGVQREFGCVHMTCLCGYAFCFTCLARWGDCRCELIPAAELRAILGED